MNSLLSLVLIFLFDLPVILIPFAIIGLIAMFVVSLVKKNFSKFFFIYSILFLLLVFGITFGAICNLVESTDYFKGPEYSILFSNLFGILGAFAVVAICYYKKDNRLFLIVPAICIVLYICKLYFYAG